MIFLWVMDEDGEFYMTSTEDYMFLGDGLLSCAVPWGFSVVSVITEADMVN